MGRRVAELGDRVDPVGARITVDGVPVPAHPELRYFALNKPRGVTSTLRDSHATQTLADFLPEGPRVFPVGRLDRDSEGLLLFTHDGELANRLQHPRYGVEKEYLVEVDGPVPSAHLRTMTAGIELDDGVAKAIRAREVQRAMGKTALSMVMAEGRKREVRRMLESLGHRIRRLVRVRIGPVSLGPLGPGRIRPLTNDEVAGLYRTTGLARATVGAHHRSSRDRSSKEARLQSRSRESRRPSATDST